MGFCFYFLPVLVLARYPHASRLVFDSYILARVFYITIRLIGLDVLAKGGLHCKMVNNRYLNQETAARTYFNEGSWGL